MHADDDGGRSERSTGELIRDIMAGAGELARQEVALARAEAKDSVQTRASGAAALGVAAGAAGLAALFASLAVATALALVVPAWVAYAIVAGALLCVAGVLALVGKRRITPRDQMRETKRSMKEDVGWARAQLSS